MKKSQSRGSESSTQFESPARFHSPLRWDAANAPESPVYFSSENSPAVDNSKAIVAVDKFTQCTPDKHHKPPEKLPPLPAREEPTRAAANAAGGGGGGEWRSQSMRREGAVRKAALGFRLSEVVACMVSFSVMAADRTQGWSGDSFERYKEYRYCLSVNIISFAYSGFQACDLVCQLVTGKHIISHHLHYHFDFFMDQVLAYLLISASSSAATRVDDWQSNWGKDEFTEMASASIGMAFVAFVAFAISSLISGYILCTRSSMRTSF